MPFSGLAACNYALQLGAHDLCSTPQRFGSILVSVRTLEAIRPLTRVEKGLQFWCASGRASSVRAMSLVGQEFWIVAVGCAKGQPNPYTY